MTLDPQSQRTLMRKRRRELDRGKIQSASVQISKKLWKIPAVQRARRIAIYMSVAGEIDCSHILNIARLRKMRVFVPILANKQLFFAPLKKQARLRRNRYQVLEPVYKRTQCILPRHLDVVVVPLLAFDAHGNRLGMGGGFYDRTFAFMKRREKLRRPLLVGVAYDFQHVPSLQAQPWDVPLHVVVTEKESYGSY